MQRRGRKVRWEELKLAVDCCGAAVQPHVWSTISSCRVRSLTSLLPRAAVPVLYCGSLEHCELSPKASVSCKLNFIVIISQRQKRAGSTPWVYLLIQFLDSEADQVKEMHAQDYT